MYAWYKEGTFGNLAARDLGKNTVLPMKEKTHVQSDEI